MNAQALVEWARARPDSDSAKLSKYAAVFEEVAHRWDTPERDGA